MKNIITTAVISLLFISCTKEELKKCNCGTVANDGIDINPECYWLEIRNDCTGNKKKFCFDEDIWLQYSPGEKICVTNQSQW